MIELSFHDALYDSAALDETVKAFEPFAEIMRERRGDLHIVRVALRAGATAEDLDFDEPTLAAELGNHALGRTIELKRAARSRSA